jgi:ketol-acid reductoisomerase
VKKADFIMMLLPDEIQSDVYEQSVLPNLSEGNVLMFAHGFNIHFNQIVPEKNIDVVMVAPRGRAIRCAANIWGGRGSRP